jgi:CTP synthase (UTP-ammonia lyase)
VRSLLVNVLMDLPPTHRSHVATMSAVHHAAYHVGLPIAVNLIRTDEVGDINQITKPGSAVIIGPGSPYRNRESVHEVVRAARERGIPLVGT